MNKYLFLEKRIRDLELLLESKQDQEKLLNFLGQEYYDKYNLIKSKISDPKYKDIYKLLKMDLDEVKEYIDSFQSTTSVKNSKKDAGAKLIYNKDGWKVYRITTYGAAQIYGSNTKWCISGRYEDHEERGEEYFNDYIEDYDLDGGYYFYIKSNTEKYCILRTNSGEISSIWNAEDRQINDAELPEDFPNVPAVMEFDPLIARYKADIFSDNYKRVKNAIEHGFNVNYVMEDDVDYDRYDNNITPLIRAIKHENVEIVELLLKNGANVSMLHPLARALKLDNSEIVGLLLDYGANPYNKMTNSAYYYINNPDVINVLRRKGVDLNKLNNEFGENILYQKLSNKDISSDLVKALLDAGIKPFQWWSKTSTLKRAVKVKDSSVLEMILDKCTNQEINMVTDTSTGDTLLHYAVKQKLTPIKYNLLLKAGCDPNQENNEGELPIDLAQSDRLKQLIKQYM